MTTTKQEIAARAHDIQSALSDANLDAEVFYDEDGDEGWHITVEFGDECYLAEGGMGREYTVAYWTRDDTWYFQQIDAEGRVSGPWPERYFAGDVTAAEVVEYVKVRLGIEESR